ncbi:hypothetical protein B0H14DRAFT_2657662 [Mycena olivaceomarginata]|nr:hypothetical protein B0H14DRAFT_2657662 [Mycena olivaceomarginata]
MAHTSTNRTCTRVQNGSLRNWSAAGHSVATSGFATISQAKKWGKPMSPIICWPQFPHLSHRFQPLVAPSYNHQRIPLISRPRKVPTGLVERNFIDLTLPEGEEAQNCD